MKQILIFASLFLLNSYAKAQTFKIVNQTDCENINWAVFADDAGSCSGSYATAYINILPRDSTIIDASTADWISDAPKGSYQWNFSVVNDPDGYCSVGRPCTGFRTTADFSTTCGGLIFAVWSIDGSGNVRVLVYY